MLWKNLNKFFWPNPVDERAKWRATEMFVTTEQFWEPRWSPDGQTLKGPVCTVQTPGRGEVMARRGGDARQRVNRVARSGHCRLNKSPCVLAYTPFPFKAVLLTLRTSTREVFSSENQGWENGLTCGQRLITVVVTAGPLETHRVWVWLPSALKPGCPGAGSL